MTTMHDPLVTVSAISIEAVVRRQRHFTLGPLTLDVPIGSVLGFVGPNGSGKTTSIKAMLGMVPIDSGTIEIMGGSIGAKHSQIGVVLDEIFLVPDWTPLNAASAIAPFYDSWDQQHFTGLLERFDVPMNNRVKDLSQGQGTKLMLALALARRPELLILDEPTSGLDPSARQDILDVFRDFMLDEQHSILFSTHITTDLEKIADYVHILNDGNTAYAGTLLDLTERYGAVRGAVSALTADARQAVLGLRARGDYYTGLIDMKHSALFDRAATIETPSLEEAVTCLGAPTRNGVKR